MGFLKTHKNAYTGTGLRLIVCLFKLFLFNLYTNIYKVAYKIKINTKNH